ncbi:MFS family permease [Phyllobacterium sp. 1468]|uniref:MFS transporter n=1 Tax=Phyllobacterium sp. 1468 TaxID=2817759 RepID=UPI00285F1D34|nr:MFS transporter [Phyllobacterium sp. 1468]MDR6632625.1 MFS family permease [Phyllobacterium sp. 1468]
MAIQHTPQTTTARKTAVASLIGTCIEWYDFYIYGTASALVFSTLFFPSYDPTVGTMLSFATFAIGALMRPLGGLICGHYGDKVGRKSMLVATLLGMGVVTFLIGLLPTYSQIGILAPILLIILRMLQGVAFGGEWGGAVLMAVEHAPKERKGFFGSFPHMGSPIALFLSTGTFSLLALLPKDDFMSWGWRIPFLLSALLVIVGMVLRLQLFESPDFQKVLDSQKVVERPVVEVFRHHWRQILVGVCVAIGPIVAFYVQTLFVVSYAMQSVGIARDVVLNAILIGSAVELVLLGAFAWLSDIIGRKPVALFGAGFTAITAYPFFLLVDGGTLGSVTAAVCMAMVGISAIYAVLPAYLSDLFEPHVRYSGISASFTLASGILGGFTPAIATGLFAWADSSVPVTIYLAIISLISFFAVLGARRRGIAPQAAQLRSVN